MINEPEGPLPIPPAYVPACTYDVTDAAYGGVGDNFTDNAGAIALAIHAITSASPAGGTLFFPVGTFLTSGLISLSTGRITIRGCQRGGTVLAYTGDLGYPTVTQANRGFITFNAGDNYKVADIEIIGQPGTLNHQVQAVGVIWNTNVHFDNVGFENWSGFALSLENQASSGSANNVDITCPTNSSGNTSGAIQLTANGDTVTFINVNGGYPSQDTEPSRGILMNPGNNPNVAVPTVGQFANRQYVAGAIFDNCSFINFNMGLAIFPDSYTVALPRIGFCNDITMTACQFDSSYNSNAVLGKLTPNTGLIEHWMFVNCWFASSAIGHGATLNDASGAMGSPGALDSISFVGCRVLNNHLNGIKMNGPSTNIGITGCLIIGNQSEEIRIGAGSSYVNIVGNKASGNADGYTMLTTDGVVLDGSGSQVSYINVVGNDLSGNSGGAIVDTTTGVTTKRFSLNIGYNPVGASVPTFANATLATNYSGVAESWIVSGGAGVTISLGDGIQPQKATGLTAGTFPVVPGGSIKIGWGTTKPAALVISD